MKKVYDLHVHYYLFDLSIDERVKIFEEEFARTGTEKFCFSSLPHHVHDGKITIDKTQNVIGLYLKKSFSPNGYAFAGLEHPSNHDDKETIAEDFLMQAKTYLSVGFDGIKMLEGYPSLVKRWALGVDDPVYDKFYAYMQECGKPVLMHIANPSANWDRNSASEHAIKAGRVYDSSYPTKEELTAQVFSVMKKFPKLRLILAHFGFFSLEKQNAEKFLSYQNTALDLTPGGEQFIKMSENWEDWLEFWQKNSDRIYYGTDLYAFPKDDKWEENFMRRPQFLRNFIETDTVHDYVDGEFKGVLLCKELQEKIYRTNFEKLLGSPTEVSVEYLKQTAKKLLTDKDVLNFGDMKYILENL